LFDLLIPLYLQIWQDMCRAVKTFFPWRTLIFMAFPFQMITADSSTAPIYLIKPGELLKFSFFAKNTRHYSRNINHTEVSRSVSFISQPGAKIALGKM